MDHDHGRSQALGALRAYAGNSKRCADAADGCLGCLAADAVAPQCGKHDGAGALKRKGPMPIRKAWHCLLTGALIACAFVPLAAQSNSFQLNLTSRPASSIEGASGYDQPPKNILDVMRAPSPP